MKPGKSTAWCSRETISCWTFRQPKESAQGCGRSGSRRPDESSNSGEPGECDARWDGMDLLQQVPAKTLPGWGGVAAILQSSNSAADQSGRADGRLEW